MTFVKVLGARGRVYYRLPCVICGVPRDAASKTGRCRNCWQGEGKLIRVGAREYRKACRCGKLISATASRCKSCETRRRHKAGLMKMPPRRQG